MSLLEGSNPSPSATRITRRPSHRRAVRFRRHEVRGSFAGEHRDRALARELRHAPPGGLGGAADVREQHRVRRREQPRVHRRARARRRRSPRRRSCRPRARRPAPPRRRPDRARCSPAPPTASSARADGRRSARASSSCSGTCSETMSDARQQVVEVGRPIRRCRCRGACGGAPPCRSRRRGGRPPGRCGRSPTMPSVRAVHVDAEEVADVEARSSGPARRSASASDGAPRRGEDQEEGEVGGGLVEHPGRVAHRDAELGGGGDVDVVVAHRDVGDDLQPRRARPAARRRRSGR